MCDYLQTLRLRANWNYKRLVVRAARVTGRIFALCRAGCALRRVGACTVFAETLRRLVGRFCAKKKPGWSPRRCPGGVLSCLIFTPSLLAEVVDSPYFRANEMQLRRRIDSVECGAFRRFGREQCPGTPRRFGVQARPETPHSVTRQILKPGASFSQGGRWILRV